jgi:glycosyltransferase involved in cell wall biosynthesis
VSAEVAPPGDPHDRITIVVMTRDRWPDLCRSLPHHDAPVVLVDNGSTDGTPELVRTHFPQVDVVALPANRGSVARNIGVERARTPYVAFADDDSWWAEGALARAARHFDRHPRLAVLGARVLVGQEERLDPTSAIMASSPLGLAPDLPGPSVLGFLACGAVVRAEPFLAAGGFDDLILFMGEEERLALDLASMGWGLAYGQWCCEPSVRTSGAAVRAGSPWRKRYASFRRPWPGAWSCRRPWSPLAGCSTTPRRRRPPRAEPAALRSAAARGARPWWSSSRRAARVRSRTRCHWRRGAGPRRPVPHRRRR